MSKQIHYYQKKKKEDLFTKLFAFRRGWSIDQGTAQSGSWEEEKVDQSVQLLWTSCSNVE